MPCDSCERGCIDPCPFGEPVWFSVWTDCGMEYDAHCDGYLPGDPGDYMIVQCKLRLGIHWLFNEAINDEI